MSVTLRFDSDGVSYFAETYESTSIQITKKVNTLDSLASQSVVTKETFRIPLQGQLAELIGYVSDINQSAKINLNKRIDGQIIVNDLPRFKGSFQVIAIYQNPINDIGEVELIFKGSETDVKQVLTDVSMSELYANEGIPYSVENIDEFISDPDSFVNDNNYIYPLIDYGRRLSGNPVSPHTVLGRDKQTELDFKPAYTIEDCFDRMPIDITWDSSIDDLVENQAILLHNTESGESITQTSSLQYTGSLETDTDQIYSSPTTTKVGFDIEYNYDIDRINLPDDFYEPILDGNYELTLTGDISLDDFAGGDLPSVVFNLYDYTNNVVIDTLWSAYNVPDFGESSVSKNIFRLFLIHIDGGIDVGIQVVFTRTSGSVELNILEGFKFEVLRSPVSSNSAVLDVSANCPEINCWDIFSTIVRQCNGIIEVSQDGVYNIIPWVNWIDSNSEIIYIDKFIDPNKNIKINPYSVKGAKRIKLTYLEDEDLLNQTYKSLQSGVYGDLDIKDTGTDFASNEIKIELPFASSPMIDIEMTGFPCVKMYNSDYEPIKGLPRLIQFERPFREIYINTRLYNTFTATDYRHDVYPYTGHWTVDASSNQIGGYSSYDYNFGESLTFFAGTGYPHNNLYQRFWRQYIEETYSENSREIVLSVGMNIEQVDRLKMNEQIIFKGAKCRLVEISNVPLTDNTTFPVKLMKRISIENIDIAPFYPNNIINSIVQWRDSTDDSNLGDASGESASDVENSCIAYGFSYDSTLNIGNQRGKLLQV